jgi:hypothetical protein
MKTENSATLSSGDKILISSGFRTIERQTTLYNEAIAQGKNTVAKPGHSEHHTGLTFDIKIYTSTGATIDLRASEQKWLEEVVSEKTGLYVDGGYMYKILTGQRNAPRIVEAVCEVLNIREEQREAIPR